MHWVDISHHVCVWIQFFLHYWIHGSCKLEITYALAAGNELPEDRISVKSRARMTIVFL